MPYLRFSRDDRGYEHTYVLHGLRSGSRPRLLYWFRTPPNVNVGRLPLDEDAIRAIEDSNAELTFDWAKMLRVKPPPAPVRPDEDGRRSRSRSGARRERRAAPERPGAGRAADDRRRRAAGPDAGRAGRQEALGAAAGSGGEPDSGVAAAGHPVAALVGDDGLARLRAQYAELRARLTESRAEPRLRERVSARVEALNPDGWRPGEEAVLGIERFESEAAAIKADLGRRRRRAPRGRRGTEEAPPTGQD
ncbi:MAG: hypothetical protein J4G16_03980 [Acidobacteria bacterium]|nr:hypothetical protein [Acidobacteriota bacterium]